MFKKIYVEITNCCNLKCSFCIGNNREKEFMSIDNFKNIIIKIKDYTKAIYLHIMGEPLLHPKINEFIDYACRYVHVNITTNGYLIKNIENNKNIRQINISLHSFNELNGKKFDDYINDIYMAVDKLIANKVIVNYRLWTGTIYKEKIIDFLQKKYKKIINDKKVKLSEGVFFEEAEEFVWPSLNNSYYSAKGTCLGCISHIGILVDGTIVPCCLDSAGIINLGNIYKTNLDDIINSKIFLDIRNGFKNNVKVHDLCKKCNFYMKKNNGDSNG